MECEKCDWPIKWSDPITTPPYAECESCGWVTYQHAEGVEDMTSVTAASISERNKT